MAGRHFVTVWMVLAVGVVLIAYGGYRWATFVPLGEQGIAIATDYAYQAQLQKVRQQIGDGYQPSKDQEQKLRAMLRAEIVAEVQRRSKAWQSWLLGGVAALMFSLGWIFLSPARHKPGPPRVDR